MKKSLFYCCFCMQILCADSIDNAILESMQKSKQEAEERKKAEQQKAGDIDEKTEQKNLKHSPFHKPSTHDVAEENKEARKTQDSYKKIAWFAGLGIGMQMPSDSNKKTDIMDIGLQGGLFLHLAQKHGFRFSLLANYHTFSGNSLYSLGGALDYFYHFNTQGLGLFGGIIGYAPIASNVLSTPNITARIGLSWTNDSIRLEFYGGYPFYQDARASNIVALGVGIFYVF